MAVESHLKVAWRSTRVLATKNVQLKRAQYKACSCGCLPCTLFWELLFPVGIIALFAYIRTESDPVTTLDGWEQAWDEGSTEKRENIPMHLEGAVAGTGKADFMRSMLLPLHLRPKYKLALAAASAADVPKVRAFREQLATQWYPRQKLPVVPCLESQRQGGDLDEATSTDVLDFADHYNTAWSEMEEPESTWIPACPAAPPNLNGSFFLGNATWPCGSASTNQLECASLSGCEWSATQSQCRPSDVFPPGDRCCTRSGAYMSHSSAWRHAGWVSSFADVTMIHGSGTAEALDQYIESDDYLTEGSPYVAAAIVFNSIDSGGWDYSIRINTTWTDDGVKTVDSPVDYLANQVEMWGTKKYLGTDSRGPSFMALQLLLDRWILQLEVPGLSSDKAIADSALSHFCPTRNCEQLAVPLRHAPYRVLFTPLPFTSRTTNDFYEFVADYLSLIFIIAYSESHQLPFLVFPFN